MALTTFTLPTESARDPRAPRDSGDAAFFAGYSWCLKPILRAVLNVPHALAARFGDRRLREWRDGWTGCVDAAARMVIRGGTPGAAEWTDLDAACRVARAHLPARVRGRRLRIPEGYRCQDLSHHDVIALARRFAQQSGERSRGQAVVGG